MNEMALPSLLLLVLMWPLLLAVAAAFGVTRSVALRLAPWAALPALATAVIPDTALQLDGAMLGGVLVLDTTGRVFLLLISVLWLASGILARPRLCAAGSSTFAVMMLLAIAGGLCMVIAGDALLFYTAATLAGYALYGVLMDGADAATRQAGRVLVVLLVVSDLLIFELLLMLGHAAAGMDFAAFRQAFIAAENRGLILGLLVVGFGIKTGLLGFHFWLPPVFVAAGAAIRPALVAYMLGAGLLGVRLLPLGEIDAPVAGEILQWLIWVTLTYAWLVGLLQAHRRSILAYAAIALGGQWLAVLSALLHLPQLWQEMTDALAAVLLQSGFALAALLLIEKAGEGKKYPPMHGYLVSGLCWLAAWLLATAPTGIAGVITDRPAAIPIYSVIAVIAFLAASSLLRRDSTAVVPNDKNMPSETGQTVRPDMHMPTVMMTAVGLTIAAALASGYKLVRLSFTETAFAALVALAAMLLAVLSAKFLVTRVPSLPPGDVLVSIRYGLALARHSSHRLADRGLTRWPEIARAVVRHLWMGVSRMSVGQWESALNRWQTALTLVLLLGLLVAWMGGL